MKKAVLLGIMLATVFTLSGCLGVTGLGGGEQPPATGQQPEWQYKCPDGEWVKDLALCGEGEHPPAGEQPLDQISAESCGSFDNMRLLVEPENQTDQEKAAVACFNAKMLNCDEGSFELTGTGGGIFSVESKEGENCLISFYDSASKEEKTCRVPSSYIVDASAAAEEAGKPELLVVMVSFGITTGSAQNTETGETITIECE